MTSELNHQSFGNSEDDKKYDDAVFFRHRDVLLWKEILKELIGWSDEKTEQWAKRYKRIVMDESSWYSHQNTLIYPVNLLIPERMQRKQKAYGLFNRLVWILTLKMTPPEMRGPADPFYDDWPYLRKEINARFQEVDYTLEKLATDLASKDPANIKIDVFRH